MAISSRTFREATRSRRVAGSAAALLFAVAGLLPLSAGIVQAHDLAVTFSCSDADLSVPVLTIDLTEFDPTFTNTVTASIDGTTVLATTTFPDAYTGTFPGGSPTASHTAIVAVTASDDPTGSQGFTKTFNLSVDPCQTVPSSAPSSAPSTPPSTAPSSAPSGGVEAATATPPATATVDSSAPTGTSSGFGFLMILFAVVALVVGFAPVGSRRKVNATTKTRRR